MRLRATIIWLTIVLQSAVGCAGPRTAVPTANDNVFAQAAYAPPTPPPSEHPMRDWLDEHPVVKYTGYTAIGALAVVGILTTTVIVSLATGHGGAPLVY